MTKTSNVNIQPELGILSVLPHVNYKPHYALAEFVDNAIDSYQKHKEALERVEGKEFVLQVKIEFDQDGKKSP